MCSLCHDYYSYFHVILFTCSFLLNCETKSICFPALLILAMKFYTKNKNLLEIAIIDYNNIIESDYF